jgi:hypothetical protein
MIWQSGQRTVLESIMRPVTSYRELKIPKNPQKLRMAARTSLAADLQRHASQWESAVSPLYVRHADGRLESVGTGIFVEHRGHVFVVTASHVLRNFINDYELLIGNPHAFPINQRHFLSADEDGHDVGFVPLTREQRALLEDVRFITRDDVAAIEQEQRRHYLVGYRADDNEPDGAPELVDARWSAYVVVSADSGEYARRGLIDADRLLLVFNRNVLFSPEGPVESEPEPEGLSGAGVWRWADNPADDKLIAIIDSHTDAGRLIYASGMMTLFQSLDEYADGTLA